MYNIDSERAGTCKIMRSAPSKWSSQRFSEINVPKTRQMYQNVCILIGNYWVDKEYIEYFVILFFILSFSS
jgi:hypothetical protein